MWVAFIRMLTIALWFALQAVLSVPLTLFPRFGNSCAHIGLFRWKTESCGQASVKCVNGPRIKDEKEPPQQGVVPSHPQPIYILTSMHHWSSTPFLKGALRCLKRGYGFSFSLGTLLQPSMSQEKDVGFKPCAVQHFTFDILGSYRLLCILLSRHLPFHGLPQSHRV